MPSKDKKRPLMAEALNVSQTGGLLSLFEQAALEAGSAVDVRDLLLGHIDHNPNQARQAFDMVLLQELASSIREHGVIEPIIVRPVGERFEIVAGERRYRAALIAEQETIPARIMTLDTQGAAIITALENLQREDLDIEDEARQFSNLLSITGLSQRRLAERLGINYNYLSRRVRLLKRPDLMEAYRSGRSKLHEVLAELDQPVSETGSDVKGDVVSQGHNPPEPGDTVSLGHNVGVTSEEIALIEREDMTGFIVSRGHSLAGSGSDQAQEGRHQPPAFRWRPAMQFRNWLTRTSVEAIPVDERASFRAQIAEIKARLEEWEKALGNEAYDGEESKVAVHEELEGEN